jgi:hypothetical protein
MSLAPSEQRALTRIEESLRNSDPQLAAMMTVFTVLVSRRRIRPWTCLSPWRLRLKRLAVVTLALAAIGAVVLAAALSGRSGH